jgi:hypothetical protein
MARRYYFDMDPDNTSATRYLSNATGATWTLTNTTPGDGLARVVTITNDSATDHSGKTAILTGTDADGKAQTETVTLPTEAGGAAPVTTSTKHFLTLTSVVPSATIGSDTMDIGIGDDIVSKTVVMNSWSDVAASAFIDVTGTINVDIEVTYDPPNRPGDFTWTDQSSPTWVPAPNFTGKTADTHSTLPTGIYAARVQINSYTDTAEVQAWIVQTESV